MFSFEIGLWKLFEGFIVHAKMVLGGQQPHMLCLLTLPVGLAKAEVTNHFSAQRATLNYSIMLFILLSHPPPPWFFFLFSVEIKQFLSLNLLLFCLQGPLFVP